MTGQVARASAPDATSRVTDGPMADHGSPPLSFEVWAGRPTPTSKASRPRGASRAGRAPSRGDVLLTGVLVAVLIAAVNHVVPEPDPTMRIELDTSGRPVAVWLVRTGDDVLLTPLPTERGGPGEPGGSTPSGDDNCSPLRSGRPGGC
jgi:hypothetical protein